MSQEATMIALDNSSYMKNGDFIPDRFVAQREAIYFICNNLKRQNAENTFGLITLSNCQVLCTLTIDNSKIYSKVSQVIPDGDITFCTSISIAHLALRNRQFRNQKPKIIIFLGSPIEDNDEELLKMARKLKKEKVSVVIITFGEAQANESKLLSFINTINGKDANSSQIITIPTGNGILEYLRSNPIIVGEQPHIGQPNTDFDIDLGDDPDLAYALRISLEDQQMRTVRPPSPELATSLKKEQLSNDEVELTKSVLDVAASASAGSNFPPPPNDAKTIDLQNMSEDEQIAYAINVSLTGQQQKVVENAQEKPDLDVDSQQSNSVELNHEPPLKRRKRK